MNIDVHEPTENDPGTIHNQRKINGTRTAKRELGCVKVPSEEEVEDREDHQGSSPSRHKKGGGLRLQENGRASESVGHVLKTMMRIRRIRIRRAMVTVEPVKAIKPTPHGCISFSDDADATL